MTMYIASVFVSREPIAEIGDHFTMERTNQSMSCQLSRWKQFLFTAGCLRNKNVLKLKAGMLGKCKNILKTF